MPALVSIVLLSIETIVLYFFLPETKGWRDGDIAVKDEIDTLEESNVPTAMSATMDQSLDLRELEWCHFSFLFFFSGQSVPTLLLLSSDART